MQATGGYALLTLVLCFILINPGCGRPATGDHTGKDGHINDHDLNIVQGTKVTEEVALTRRYKTPINSE